MEILSLLHSSCSPLTKCEIIKYCGPLFSEEKLKNYVKHGDVGVIKVGETHVYYPVPLMLKKNVNSVLGTSVRTLTAAERTKEIDHVVELRNTLIKLSNEYESLKPMEKNLPSEEEMNKRIKNLNKFNEVKDIAIMISGHLADMECVHVSEIYEKFNVDEKMLK